MSGNYGVIGPNARGKYAVYYISDTHSTVIGLYNDEFTAWRHKRALVKFSLLQYNNSIIRFLLLFP